MIKNSSYIDLRFANEHLSGRDNTGKNRNIE